MGLTHHILDVYDARLWLATDRRQWATLRRRLTFLDKAPESAGRCDFAVWEPNAGGLSVPCIAIWVDVAQHRHPHELLNTCAHEATHAAAGLLTHIGHREVDEPHAYLVGWLTEWIWSHCPPLKAA